MPFTKPNNTSPPPPSLPPSFLLYSIPLFRNNTQTEAGNLYNVQSQTGDVMKLKCAGRPLSTWEHYPWH